MTRRRIFAGIVLCGIVTSGWMPLCRAQDTDIEKLLDVKAPQTEPAEAFSLARKPEVAPERAKKPEGEISQKAWYWRILEGMVLGAAVFHTQKENDGRLLAPPGYR
jgi:hypothetical protein